MPDYYSTNAYSRGNAGGTNDNQQDNTTASSKYYSTNTSGSNNNNHNDFYSNPYGQSQTQQPQQQQQQQQPSIFSNLANAAASSNTNNQNNMNSNNATPSFWSPVATQFASATLNSFVAGANTNGANGPGGVPNNNIDPYAQIAIDQGRTFVTSYTAKLIPGLETFMNTFRKYFAVDNGYVKRKMVRVLFSFFCKNWSRKKIETPIPTPGVGAAAPTQSVTGGVGPSSSFTTTTAAAAANTTTTMTMTYAVPREDDNAPDLYIPFMSLITYVLISALCYGTAGHFDPEIIVDVTTKCILTQLVEVCLFKVGVYMVSSGSAGGVGVGDNSGIAFWDLFAFTGYKYLALTCNLIIGFGVSMVGSGSAGGSGSGAGFTGESSTTDGSGVDDGEDAPVVVERATAGVVGGSAGGYGQRGYYIMFLWTASSICYFMLKTMANNIPSKQQQQQQQHQQYYPQTMQHQQKNGLTREIVVLVFALSQFVTLWFLGQTKFLN